MGDGALAGVGPVEEDHAAVAAVAEVVLPVAMEERLRRVEQGHRQGRDRSGARRSRRRRRRAPATRSAPNLRRGCGDVLRVAQRGLTVELRLAEPCPPEAVGRSPRSSCQPLARRQAGDGLEERQVDLLGDGLVADGDELVGDVAHEQGHAPAVAAPGRRPERGVVDEAGDRIHQAGRPHPPRPAPDVARDPHREVRLRVHVLHDAALAVDLDVLERGADRGPRAGGRQCAWPRRAAPRRNRPRVGGPKRVSGFITGESMPGSWRRCLATPLQRQLQTCCTAWRRWSGSPNT